MSDLSPQSQAVLHEFWQSPVSPSRNVQIAAALRAAAERIKPDLNRTPWITNEDGYFNETFENMKALGEMNAYYKILAIAAELENN